MLVETRIRFIDFYRFYSRFSLSLKILSMSPTVLKILSIFIVFVYLTHLCQESNTKPWRTV